MLLVADVGRMSWFLELSALVVSHRQGRLVREACSMFSEMQPAAGRGFVLERMIQFRSARCGPRRILAGCGGAGTQIEEKR